MNSAEPTKASAPQVISEVALILAAILHHLETPGRPRLKVAPRRSYQARTEQALRRLARRPASNEKSRALLNRGFHAISLQIAAMQRRAKKALEPSGLQESPEERFCKSEESAERLRAIVKQIRSQVHDFFAALESGKEGYYVEPVAPAPDVAAADPAYLPYHQIYRIQGQG
jgi:hypothetical protein